MTRLPELGSFAEPALLILVSLSQGPKHGCAVMVDIEAGPGRAIGPGTLYAPIARLEARGLVEPMASVDRRRRYRLTPAGVALVRAQLTELPTFASLGLQHTAEGPG